jgi:hypothetical protein
MSERVVEKSEGSIVLDVRVGKVEVSDQVINRGSKGSQGCLCVPKRILKALRM